MATPGSPLNNIPTSPTLKKLPKFKVGQVVGKLTIIEYLGFGYGTRWFKNHNYLTKCTCGNTRKVSQNYLISGKALKKCEACTKKYIALQQLKKQKKCPSKNSISVKEVTSLKWC